MRDFHSNNSFFLLELLLTSIKQVGSKFAQQTTNSIFNLWCLKAQLGGYESTIAMLPHTTRKFNHIRRNTILENSQNRIRIRFLLSSTTPTTCFLFSFSFPITITNSNIFCFFPINSSTNFAINFSRYSERTKTALIFGNAFQKRTE